MLGTVIIVLMGIGLTVVVGFIFYDSSFTTNTVSSK